MGASVLMIMTPFVCIGRLLDVQTNTQNQYPSLNRFLIENVAVGDHYWRRARPPMCCRKFRWGDPSEKLRAKHKGVPVRESALAAVDDVRRCRWCCSRNALFASA